jgi:hypothetical protein
MKLLPQFTDTSLRNLIGYFDEKHNYEILTKPQFEHGGWTCLAKGWFGLAFIQITLRPLN